MPEIVVKFSEKIIERVVTEKEHISIGRTTENDIVLDNRGVSRKHAQIEFSDQGAVLIDNDSLNGTFVNQRKVTEQPLHDNDVITIGKYDLVFYADAQPSRKMSDMDGTMVLSTRKHKDLVEQDRQDKEMAGEVGGTILLALNDTEQVEVLSRSGDNDVRQGQLRHCSGTRVFRVETAGQDHQRRRCLHRV